MTLFIALLILANGLIAYYCYINAQLKGYPQTVFMILGLLPYFNLAVLVYLLFFPLSIRVYACEYFSGVSHMLC